MKKQPAKAGPQTTTEKKNLPYSFSNAELLLIARKAAEEQARLKALEESKKMVMDEWKAKISACQAEITNLSNKVTTGIEYRDIECIVTFDDPIQNQKCSRRRDNGEIAYIMEMSSWEIEKVSQATLPLDEQD